MPGLPVAVAHPGGQSGRQSVDLEQFRWWTFGRLFQLRQGLIGSALLLQVARVVAADSRQGTFRGVSRIRLGMVSAQLQRGPPLPIGEFGVAPPALGGPFQPQLNLFFQPTLRLIIRQQP